MIDSLRGPLIHVEPGFAVVECAGVGYKCLTSLSTLGRLPPVGKEVTLYTHLNVREDAVELFGFAERGELHCFKLLTSVSGVGPKVGLAILSTLPPDRVALAIVGGDAKSLTQAPGVGQKLAQRIVLELKDKLGKESLALPGEEGAPFTLPTQGGSAPEAVAALVVLGYAQSEAAAVIARMDGTLPVEDLIRQALKLLGGVR